MATGSNLLARNQMLQAIKDWNPGSQGTAIRIGAYETDNSASVVTAQTATYGTPASGSMNISSNVVLSIPENTSVGHLRIQKGDYPNDTFIYKKDIATESFTFAGTITITSAQISIADAT
jgi:hypothetical protein